MSGISLTASMRSNLLSLQNIASQQDIVQNRLATGLKVSSAIDNPSSYYTATSLNNRAADLTALLDSMSQGIQTIKAASEAIDSGTKFLEQAKAVANQALETAQPVIARVSNEAELKQAVASGEQGFIVLTADITLTDTLELRNGQKLVGDNYFSTDKGINRKLSFEFSGHNNDGIRLGNNGLVANLDISYTSDYNDTSKEYGAIHADGCQNAVIENVNIKMSSSGTPYLYGIYTNNAAQAEIRGNINIFGSDAKIGGVANYGEAVLNIRAVLNINTQYFSLKTGDGSSKQPNARTNILSGSTINIKSTHRGITTYARSVLTIDNAIINMDTGSGLTTTEDSSLSISRSKINIKSVNTALIVSNADVKISSSILNLESTTTTALHFSDNNNYTKRGNLNIDGNSRLNIKTLSSQSAIKIQKLSSTVTMPTILNIQSGAVININRDSAGINLFRFIDNYSQSWTIGANNTVNDFPADKATQSTGEDIPATAPEIPDIDIEMAKDFTAAQNNGTDTFRYNQIINQYDDLISDASYKGINLLNSQRLKINFNEDRSSGIEILGVSALSADLGIVTTEWQSKADIEKSVSELEEAINTLRGYASQYGNYYSIVTTRQDFTENLINVLEEGADKLTLADMNQESANMLALQTSQQLAVNSLSLASQASQAVLRLF